MGLADDLFAQYGDQIINEAIGDIGVNGASLDSLDGLGDEMVAWLQSALESSSVAPLEPAITFSHNQKPSASLKNVKGSAKTLTTTFEIKIDGDVGRPSLNPNNRLNNIVKLLNYGYNIGGRISDKKLPRGYWRGQMIKAKRSRAGTGFLQSFVDTFSRRKGVMKIEMNGDFNK